MNTLPFAATTPVSVASVGLRARDGEALARFYKDVIGLVEISRQGGMIALGAGGRTLLEIEEDASATPDDPRQAGLFHTAFLLPERTDLARWALFARDGNLRLEGASDHLVSEALYLSDPEGNGIEIYADRAPESWTKTGDGIAMATNPLDFQSLLATMPEGDEGWRGAPENTVVGHVHLRVGDPATAEEWWHEAQGFETMARYGDRAVFLATGGYHHHIGANSWRSAGAAGRDPHRAGLSWVRLSSSNATQEKEFADPWGTLIRVAPA
ncbi:VOC family protein [Nitratireductor pacificus]|uniref:Glyoxalase/bleomycin resistance protein/dioxygenase n=1 Tax=Nitratireductor pacificus pht-3B TaxID=391937 RepID=K2LPT6_9HYPH|nr:VOC family protein [Nitratireductor pacificus]EKF19684.1 glyoxalase/bleomycin resistance protein/dioxygenase [Nitratireductor pacificus pht-3B]